jgi:hypothetical protein
MVHVMTELDVVHYPLRFLQVNHDFADAIEDSKMLVVNPNSSNFSTAESFPQLCGKPFGKASLISRNRSR